MSEISFFEEEELEYGRTERVYVLIIYDIVDQKRRTKFAQYLQGYGYRVQKSCFEAKITRKKYQKLLRGIPRHINSKEDSVRVYKLTGKHQVTTWGSSEDMELEEVILI